MPVTSCQTHWCNWDPPHMQPPVVIQLMELFISLFGLHATSWLIRSWGVKATQLFLLCFLNSALVHPVSYKYSIFNPSSMPLLMMLPPQECHYSAPPVNKSVSVSSPVWIWCCLWMTSGNAYLLPHSTPVALVIITEQSSIWLSLRHYAKADPTGPAFVELML